jgi:phenylpropionate dioxygenase-like ring-hydroxylating dioxygenase large terminal subunit
MEVPFTWRPIGWFMIGWSAEFPAAEVRPLRYLGQDLVAYRTDEGELHVLDGHCLHLGAHLGHHGKVHGDCVECPYHGWRWGPDGENKYIPYEDRPNVSKKLGTWVIDERHDCVFVWHDPRGGAPRWELPDLFGYPSHLPGNQADYYRAYPELSVKYDREPVHPQIPLENTPDSEHFRYVHRATVHPVLIDWSVNGPFYEARSGWPVPERSGRPDSMALVLNSISCGVGGTFVTFEGNTHYRVAFFHTPVDDETSDLFYSIWWPRQEGDKDLAAPADVVERVTKNFLSTLEDDLEIWRYQVYVENPVLAKADARPYGALRKWARQFYELDPA